MMPAQVKEARRRHKEGEGVRALARSMNVPVRVMSRALRSKDHRKCTTPRVGASRLLRLPFLEIGRNLTIAARLRIV
jgi:hypothetical protein